MIDRASDRPDNAVGEVLARRCGALGRLTLHRPTAFNALTLGMVQAIDVALDSWQDDPAVAVVLLDGAGDRAFCAGGDIRALYEAARIGDYAAMTAFFRAEYRLNGRLARFPKPIVSFMDGITMGGGIGLGSHVSHRVVTERSVLAMPEVKIGFAPDVGGTYLLSRAPGEIGTHLGLTGSRLDAADALLCDLADVHVPAERLRDLSLALARCRDGDEVRACLDGVATEPAPGRLASARDWIDRCYAAGTVEEVGDALRSAPEPAARAAGAEVAVNAPTSLKVTLQALRDARHLSLEQCLDREFHTSCSITRQPDFIEGVRAAVVDKDRSPHWAPSRLSDVGRQEVLRHLGPMGDQELGLRGGS